MARKAATEKLVEGRKLWMDFVVIDFKRENAFIIGYDGEITMTIPRSAFWHIVDKVEEGVLNKGKE
jgi:hypothetical protein